MSIKINMILKFAIIILLSPIIFGVFSYVVDFIMQLGRIFGTYIRCIMSL